MHRKMMPRETQKWRTQIVILIQRPRYQQERGRQRVAYKSPSFHSLDSNGCQKMLNMKHRSAEIIWGKVLLLLLGLPIKDQLDGAWCHVASSGMSSNNSSGLSNNNKVRSKSKTTIHQRLGRFLALLSTCCFSCVKQTETIHSRWQLVLRALQVHTLCMLILLVDSDSFCTLGASFATCVRWCCVERFEQLIKRKREGKSTSCYLWYCVCIIEYASIRFLQFACPLSGICFCSRLYK